MSDLTNNLYGDEDWFEDGIETALSELGGSDRILEAPSNDDELHAAVLRYFNINIPRNKICDDHVAPFQAFADAYFARSPIAVWKASRGFGGKSLTLSLLSASEAAFMGAKVNLLGGSGEQSERVLAYMNGEEMPDALWGARNAPLWLILGGRGDGLQKRLTRLVNGGYVKALMASQTSVRGPHPQRLRLDEIDEMDMAIFDAALGQPMTRDGIRSQIVGSSTHHNANGTMTAILKRASDKDWPVYEWCYRENLKSNGGWLDDQEVNDKKAVVTVAMWNTEYENQEPNPEGRAIDTKAVTRAFSTKLGHFRGTAHEYVEIEEPYKGGDPEPVCHRCNHPYFTDILLQCRNCGAERKASRPGLYSTGTDWAKRQDWTVITTFRYDVWPVRMVAFLRTGRSAWPVMVKKLEDRLKRYGGQSYHDITGIGDVIGDYISGVASEGIWMQGQDRANMLSAYIAAIEKGNIVFPRIDWVYDQHRLASIEDVYSTGKKYHLPDSISSGALAFRGIFVGQTGQILIPGQNVMVKEGDQDNSLPKPLSDGKNKFLAGR